MPITAESADGTRHEFPDGTDRSVIDRVMKSYATQGKALPQTMQHRQDMGVGERLKTGFMDPFYGAQQLFEHAGGGNPEAIDQRIQQREQDIRQRGGGGFDFARTAGSMANPLNLFPAGAAAGAAKPLMRAGAGAVGGMIGGATAPATGNDFASEKVKQAGLGAAAGAVLGGAGGAARSTINKPNVSTADELEASAKATYDALKGSNSRVSGAAFQTVRQTVVDQLRANHFRDYLHPQTFAVMKEIGDHKGDLDIGDIKGFQELLKNVGGEPKDREAARFAGDMFDRYLSQIPPAHVISGNPARDAAALRIAQQNYRAAKRSDAIDMSMDRAKRQASRSGVGANIDNTTRQRIDAIINSPTESRRYSPEELETLKGIVNGTLPGNLLRQVGKFAPTSVVSAGPTIAAGLVGGGADAGALAATGFGAKLGGDYLTKRAGRKFAEDIRAKAPLSQARPPAPPPPALQRAAAAVPAALAPGAGSALAAGGGNDALDALSPVSSAQAAENPLRGGKPPADEALGDKPTHGGVLALPEVGAGRGGSIAQGSLSSRLSAAKLDRNTFDALTPELEKLSGAELRATAKEFLGREPIQKTKGEIIQAIRIRQRQDELNSDRSRAQDKIKP